MKTRMDGINLMINEARTAGRKAGCKELEELQKAGPAFTVHNADLAGNATGPIIGTMLDVCGNAWICIQGYGGSQKLKDLKMFCNLYGDSRRVLFQNSTYHGKMLSIFDMTGRQEMSVNVAANEAALEVLKKCGYQGYVHSYID